MSEKQKPRAICLLGIKGPEQGSANFFREEPDSEYFMLCRL